MKLLRHTHVVRLFEVMQTAKHIYIVLELVDGGELYDFLQQSHRLQQHTMEAEATYHRQQQQRGRAGAANEAGHRSGPQGGVSELCGAGIVPAGCTGVKGGSSRQWGVKSGRQRLASALNRA